MEKINWSHDFSVGVDILDHQHKHFLKVINKLIDNRHLSLNSEQITSIFQELKIYTNIHFHLEEQLMERYGFPNLESHQQEHRKFEQELANLIVDFDNTSFDELINKLTEWATGHILHDDKDYGKFFAEKEVF